MLRYVIVDHDIFYVDSFVLVNGVVVLDMTAVPTDDGDPEYSSDLTLVDLYLGLSNMLRKSAVRTFES